MPLDHQSAWALVRGLDDPVHLERPRDYDHTAARVRFDRLAASLEQRFHCACAVDRHVEDASHHGVIIIPDTATASGDHITITVSNFGNLAAVTLGNPGSYDEQEEQELLHSSDRQQIETELHELGYTAISEHILWATYDGVSDLASRSSPRHPPTWWTRFFDYL